MNRTRIKICGVMRREDALEAARAGADAIGMVFYPKARRCITSETGIEIVRALPAFVTPVALFVDQEIDEVRRLASTLRVRHVQLHGHETPETVAALREYKVLKAIRADRATLPAELEMWREAVESLDLAHLAGIILETPGTTGGSGAENDWDAIAAAQRDGLFAGLPPIIAAGGLHPGNVTAVVRQIRPWAVDVSSGVEEMFGQKSPAKIHAFMEAVRQAQ